MHDRLASSRQRWRMIRQRWLRWQLKLIEPPLQRCVTTIAGWRRGGLQTIVLVGRTTKPDVHVRCVAIPRSDQPQPGAIALHILAELALDRGVDQDAVDLR